MNRNIVITGEGIVSAIGLNKASVLNSLKQKNSGIRRMKYLLSEHTELPVGEVQLSTEEMKARLGVSSSSLIGRTSLMGMMAIEQALADAQIIRRKSTGIRPLRIALFSGTTVGGMDVTEQFFSEMQQTDLHLACLNTHDCGSSTELMAAHFGIFDEYTTLSTACSSAANAIILGANFIKSGQADIVVAGGSEALSKFHLNGFNSLMILDKEQCRPFDESRAGLNLGEGAAFVVMESEELAKERNADIHAYLTGYGNACDAFHQTASSPDGQGAYLAMTEALHTAGLQSEDIDYINAHGTGTPNNDLCESVAIQRVFGKSMPLVSSTKSFTGHTTSVSGSIESVICILALQNQFVPANLSWSTPMKEGIIPTAGEEHCRLENVVCNSFGFGGNDSSLIFSLHPSAGPAFDFKADKQIKVLSKVEISNENQLTEIQEYVKPLEARRMGKLMKSSLLASLKALKEAGIESADAIITGTSLGCLENSEKFLTQLCEEGEQMLKPTLFMQSTHNTIGCNIAIRTKCHGYNVTYTQKELSLEWALRDAELLLKSGKVKTVLVGCHDETTATYRGLMEKLGCTHLPSIQSTAMILTCTD